MGKRHADDGQSGMEMEMKMEVDGMEEVRTEVGHIGTDEVDRFRISGESCYSLSLDQS